MYVGFVLQLLPLGYLNTLSPPSVALACTHVAFAVVFVEYTVIVAILAALDYVAAAAIASLLDYAAAATVVFPGSALLRRRLAARRRTLV